MITHRDLWLAALLDRPGIPNYNKPRHLLMSGLIKLRDLPGNYWNADPLFVSTRTQTAEESCHGTSPHPSERRHRPRPSQSRRH